MNWRWSLYGYIVVAAVVSLHNSIYFDLVFCMCVCCGKVCFLGLKNDWLLCM